MDTNDIPQPAPENGDVEIARANRRGRALLAAAFVFGLALIAGFQFYALPLLKTTTAPGFMRNAIDTAKTLFITVAGLATLTAALWIFHALRILRYRQDPPPGAWLWRDTRIVRGKAAVRRAWLSIIAAVAMCAACVGLTVYIAAKLDRQSMPSWLHGGIDNVPTLATVPLKVEPATAAPPRPSVSASMSASASGHR